MSSSAVSFDFYAVFGREVREIAQTRTRIADLMWGHCLERSKFGEQHYREALVTHSTTGSSPCADHVNYLAENPIPIATIRNWLLPADETVRRLRSNRVASKPIRTEETCEWFQQYLLGFLRGEQRTLAVSGAMGCGKSTIAGWVEERLQRPLGQKYYQTFSLDFGVFSSASYTEDIFAECVYRRARRSKRM